MKETGFLSALLPSHPDILTIINEIRNKYKIPEISPDDSQVNIVR